MYNINKTVDICFSQEKKRLLSLCDKSSRIKICFESLYKSAPSAESDFRFRGNETIFTRSVKKTLKQNKESIKIRQSNKAIIFYLNWREL